MANWTPLVSSLAAGSTTGNTFTTSAISTVGATLIVVSITTINGGATLTDNQSNSWTALTTHTGPTTITLQWFYCSIPTTNASHTFTATTAAGQAPTVTVQSFSSVPSSPFDVQNGAFGNSGVSLATGSITPSQNGELIVSVFGSNTSSSLYGPSSLLGVTGSVVEVAGKCFSSAAAYGVQGTAAAFNPSWVWTSGATLNAVGIAAFKLNSPPSAGGGAWAFA